jgi:hypothetical protein
MNRLTARLQRDERGAIGIQIAGIILGPIVAMAVAMATLSALQTGAGLGEALQRGTIAQLMLDDFGSAAGAASQITVQSPKQFTVVTDPANLPPALPVTTQRVGSTCVTSVWSFTPAGGLTDLVHVQKTHKTASCASEVASEVKTKLTGIQGDAKFVYQNSSGRELSASSTGVLTPVTGTAPAGVSVGAWKSTKVGAIEMQATMNEMFGNRSLRATTIAP